MLVEFYLAAGLGRVWLRLNPALRQTLGNGPDACLMAAVNREIPPALLWRAQEFAVRVWWRTAMAAMLACFAVAVMITAVFGRGSRIGGWLLASVTIVLVTAMAAAMVQMMISRYRAGQTGRYIAKGGTKTLDGYENGYPTRYDFSFGTGLAVIVAGILGYAGLHSLF
jgi:hypothetical protein